MNAQYALERKLLARAVQSASPAPAEQRIELPLPPSANRLWYNEVRGGRAYRKRTGEYFEYKKVVAQCCAQQRIQCYRHGDRLAVTKTFYRTARAGGDLDNYSKALLDSLSGIAWVDDDQIVESHDYLVIDASPRVVLIVRRLEGTE